MDDELFEKPGWLGGDAKGWSRYRALISTWTLLCFAGFLAVAADARSEGALKPPAPKELRKTLERCGAEAHFDVPALTPGQWVDVSRGKLVRFREPPKTPGGIQGVIALKWFDLPRDVVWIATQDPHFNAVSELSDLKLTESDVEPAQWYGFLDLPWPFRNRQWVIDVWDHHALARSTHGQCWEHVWELSKPLDLEAAWQAIDRGALPGVRPEKARKAIVVPVNHGAWLAMVPPGGGTLLVWHATSSVGGSVPDRLVVSNAFRGVGKLFGNLEQRARHKVRVHYRDGHAPILGGDGKPMPFYDD